MKRLAVVFASVAAFVSLSAASGPAPAPAYSAAGMAAAKALMLQSVPPPGTCTGQQYQQLIQQCIQWQCASGGQAPSPSCINNCIWQADQACGVS